MKVIDDKERAEAAGIHQAETADGRTAQPAQPGAAVAVETDLGTPTAAPGAPEEAASAADLPLSAPDGEAEARAGGHVSDEITAIVEALVFASPDPVTLKTLCKLLETEPKEDVEAALEALQADYARPGGLQLVQVAGGYQIVTRPELHEWVRRLFHERKTQKLSVQALETLAVIAYKQPVTAPEIAEIRGVNTAGVLSTLLERHLIKIAGRKPVVGRPFLYATTKEFLIRFGLNDLTDLPKVEDMAEALGLEAPILIERTPPEEMLPLDEPDAEDEGDPGESVH